MDFLRHFTIMSRSYDSGYNMQWTRQEVKNMTTKNAWEFKTSPK